MIKFEEIADIPDEKMRRIVSALSAATLAAALKTSSPAMEEKFLGSMHPHVAEMIERAIDEREDPNPQEVKEARDAIVKVIEELA